VILGFGSAADVLVIDPFTAPDAAGPLVIIITGALPQSLSSSTQDTSILGGERDILLTATSGSPQSLLTSGVNGGEWAISSPPSAAGFSVMQYDGVDGSTTLNPTGLGGVDLTTSNSDAFHCFIQADHETTYTFTVYSGSASSSRVVTITGNDQLSEFFVKYSDFVGNANFAAAGAIEIKVEALVDVDSFITLFATSGEPENPPPPGVSPTPNVPGFTWYTIDDDNGREPCEDERPTPPYFQDNDNIVYYYFYGQDEVNVFTPDFFSSASIVVPTVSMLFALVVASLL
jgi:hypothetical protein